MSDSSANTDQSMFETVLASTVHDMKNSLSLLLSQLDNISDRLHQDTENQRAVNDLRYQANRINISLMELLTLYKLEKKQIGIHFAEIMVVDFLEDCIAAHSQLAASKGLKLELQCDDSIMWFFDPDMVAIALNNIIGNCLRYTATQVQVTASLKKGYLCIDIDDDGPGYPQNMLQEIDRFENRVNFNTGSTGLGLYFAASIAQRHKRKDRQGRIQLKNHGTSGGGNFQICLP